MGCACPKKMPNEIDLDISQENKDNLNSKELLYHKNNENDNNNTLMQNNNRDNDKNDTLIGNKNTEAFFDYKKEIKKNEDKDNNIINNEYNQRAFDLINKIRLNPPEYSKIILDNIKNISIENQLELNKNNGMEELKQIIVFKKKVKVKLFKGEKCFIEAANILRNTPSMDILKFNKDIVIPIPNTEEEINNSKYIKNKINDIMHKSNINAYFKENIKNPEIAVLLMIVDDNENSNGKKRKSLLNKDFKNIGIDSKFFGKNFIAHFSFSK